MGVNKRRAGAGGHRVWTCAICVSAIVFWGGMGLAQSTPDTPQSLVAQARSLVEGTAPPYDADEAEALRNARQLLDRVVAEFPASDISVRILVQDMIDGLDVAQLDQAVAGLPAAETPPAATGAVAAVPAPVTPEALLGEARALVNGTEAPYDPAEIAALRDARTALDRIVSEFPASDLAVRVIIRDTIEGLDIARLDADLAGATSPVTTASPQPMIPTFNIVEEDQGLREVGNCLVSDQGVGGEIIVEVDIDGDGNVADLPRLIDPRAPSAGQRKLFAKVISALETCAPYGSQAAGTHRLTASSDSIRLLEAVSNPVAPVTAPTSLGALLGTPGAGTPATTPETPPVVWTPATAATHKALNLTRKDVAEIQARLSALGHDPRGIDGVSGKGTRNALSDWQATAGIPVTGYLDQPQLAEFRARSEEAFVIWQQDEANARTLKKAPAVTKRKAKKLPPGYFWYKGRMCRKVIGNAVISCK